MKQLAAISHNLFYDSEKKPMLETIFLIHEPEWEMVDNQPVRRQKLKEVRVFNKFETIKNMFTEFIEETEKIIKDSEGEL